MLEPTQDKFTYIKSALNMVEVEDILNSVTAHYLNKYATEIEKAPNADNYGSQSEWIKKAVTWFIADIHRDKLALWKVIPERFHNTAIYQRLQLSQFIRSK